MMVADRAIEPHASKEQAGEIEIAVMLAAMERDSMKDLNKVVGETIKAQIGGDKDHGWGQKDSMVVILEIIHADVENAVEAKQDMAKFTISEVAEGLINDFVNPSAARQKLESAGLLNKSAKAERKKALWADLAK